MRASRIQSGKCYLHHHGEFDRVCRRPIYKQYRRSRCFSFPSSLKCPFCRQFLRALFDRLFSLAVIILSSWYIMQLSFRMCASHVISFFRNFAKISVYNFFPCQSRSVVFSFFARNIRRALYPFAQESVSASFVADEFWRARFSENLTSWGKIRTEQMRFNFSRRTSGCTLKTRFANKLRKIFRKNAGFWETWRLLLHRAFIIHSHYTFLRFAATFYEKKNGAIFCVIFMTRWMVIFAIFDHLGECDRYY